MSAQTDTPPETKPEFGTPRPADLTKETPRFCNELERVLPGSGFVRYVVRGLHENYPQKYVLANDEDEARLHYLEVILKDVPRNAERLKAEDLVVDTLPD